MKTTTKKEENVMNVANPTEMKENPVLSSEELFNVEGGEDVDLDEDCYTQQCVIGANICINVSTACVIAN
ncbi:hypothetical protein SAMN05216354_1617 [Xylanibacter ruminicola]|jgi:hypothetical protein|uniref:Uncharacterized protein n=1 Tax=Xylanibacter ruminicola TaxID=839 RepID=A0A1H5UX78_XYLRU|nr:MULTISPECIES: hypothetical protein [Prevotellaceae]MCR5471171.1 hypothetical protein [Prevotella sp.]SEF79752.1 hypothetical protein SAMN05216354_1617 [Xylanibacter ruminicola]SEW26252.1 hypothetical protein SAMN04487827_2430 [Prevotella sp. khp7]